MATAEIQTRSVEWSELNAISTERRALFAILSFHLGEINCLQRLALLTTSREYENEHLDQLAMMQANTLIRTLSSKLFEFLVFISDDDGKFRRHFDLDTLRKDFLSEAEELKLDKGYFIAEEVRRKVAFHLDLNRAIQSVRNFSRDFEVTFYIGKHDGNFAFPIGEHLVFDGLLPCTDQSRKAGISSAGDLDAWIKWTSKVTYLAKRFHIAVYEAFLRPTLDGIMKNGAPICDHEAYVAVPGSTAMPLFLED